MPEPIGNQYRLAIGSFDQVFQHLQFSLMNQAHITVLIVNSSVTHLQELIGKRSRIRCIDVPVFQWNNQVGFHQIINILLCLAHLDFMGNTHIFRHLQIIQCLHADGDIADLPVDLFFRTRSDRILIHNPCVRVHRAGTEIRFTIPTDKPAQPLAAVQNPDLRPQIHEAIGSRCACQANPALYIWTNLPQPFETLGLIVLEG